MSHPMRHHPPASHAFMSHRFASHQRVCTRPTSMACGTARSLCPHRPFAPRAASSPSRACDPLLSPLRAHQPAAGEGPSAGWFSPETCSGGLGSSPWRRDHRLPTAASAAPPTARRATAASQDRVCVGSHLLLHVCWRRESTTSLPPACEAMSCGRADYAGGPAGGVTT